MANVVIFDKATKAVTAILYSVNTPDYDKRDDVLINPVLAPVAGVPVEYMKVDAGAVKEMSVAEKAAVDAVKPAPVPSFEDRLKDLEARVTALEKP